MCGQACGKEKSLAVILFKYDKSRVIINSTT